MDPHLNFKKHSVEHGGCLLKTDIVGKQGEHMDREQSVV